MLTRCKNVEIKIKKNVKNVKNVTRIKKNVCKSSIKNVKLHVHSMVPKHCLSGKDVSEKILASSTPI